MLIERTPEGRMRLVSDFHALGLLESFTPESESVSARNARHPVTRWRRDRRIKITGRRLKTERKRLRYLLERVRRAEARTGARRVPKRLLGDLRKAANHVADNVALLEGTLETLMQESAA